MPHFLSKSQKQRRKTAKSFAPTTEEKTEDPPPPNPCRALAARSVLSEQQQTARGEAPGASVRLHLVKGGLQAGRGASRKHQLDVHLHAMV